MFPNQQPGGVPSANPQKKYDTSTNTFVKPKPKKPFPKGGKFAPKKPKGAMPPQPGQPSASSGGGLPPQQY